MNSQDQERMCQISLLALAIHRLVIANFFPTGQRGRSVLVSQLCLVSDVIHYEIVKGNYFTEVSSGRVYSHQPL